MDGVRDENLLDSALKAPFQTFGGKEFYPDILDKATQLCYSLIENHPFAAGKINKDNVKEWLINHKI